jgi:transposase
VARHKTCLHRPEPPSEEPESEPPAPPVEPEPTGRLADRRREHHALVHDLLQQDMSIRQIAVHLGWGRHTVQRYARALTWQEMTGRRPATSSLDPYKSHLRAGYTGRRGNIQTLHHEITAQGFRGSYSTVRDFLQRCPTPEQPTPPPLPPSVRQVTGWICRKPADLTDDESHSLTAILNQCPELRTAHDLVRGFANMLTQRHGATELASWISAATTADLPGISTFAQHLNADLEAVTAGLTLPWSSGPVEGTVNRIILWNQKSQTEGPSLGCLTLVVWPAVNGSELRKKTLMPHKRPHELRRAASHRSHWRMVPHVPGLAGVVQQEISQIELRTATNWAKSGLWPGAVAEALSGWSSTSQDPSQRHFHPCGCCGRSSRGLLDEVLAMLSAPSARALEFLIAPLDAGFRIRTLANPLAPKDLPWWARRV